MANSKTDTGDIIEPIADSIAQLMDRWQCSRPWILTLIKQGYEDADGNQQTLDDFWDGRIHKVTRESSDRYIATKLAVAAAARKAGQKPGLPSNIARGKAKREAAQVQA
jgi:hypothetical protein